MTFIIQIETSHVIKKYYPIGIGSIAFLRKKKSDSINFI